MRTEWSRSWSTCSAMPSAIHPRTAPSPRWSRRRPAAWSFWWRTRDPALRPAKPKRSSTSTSPAQERSGSGTASAFPSRVGWPGCWGAISWPCRGPARADNSCCECPPRGPDQKGAFTNVWAEFIDQILKVDAMKVLLVEDDRKVAGFIEQGLKEEGYVDDVAADGDEASMLAHVYEYDMILLDVMLPKKNGFQVAMELRREGRKTPILMLTSRDAVEDVVRGLDAGADDYLAKPFRFEELLARIRALSRRGGAERMEVLRFGEITLDRLRHMATVGQRKLDLTAKEFQLLEYFLLHVEAVVRRTTLLEKVWDMHFDPESNVVDVHVGNLRRKLAALTNTERIETVRGVGFSLRHAAQPESALRSPPTSARPAGCSSGRPPP